MAIPLERCAAMRAEMDGGRLRDEVLVRAGVSADEWTVAQREWLDKMGAELAVGRFELTNRYTQAFLERQRELAAPGAAAPPAIAPPPVLPAPVAIPVPAPAAVTPITVVGATSPWATGGDDSASGPETNPMPSVAAMEGTHEPAPSPLRSALPFRPASPDSPPPQPPPQPAPAPRPAQSGKTTAIPALGALGATMVGSTSPFAEVLPFMRPKASPSEPHAAPAPATPPNAPAAAPPATAAAPPAAAASPAPASPVLVGGLTLEQHASLCAELGHTPARAAEVLARYRVTAEAKATMDQEWKGRFGADAALERRWQEAYRLYAQFLAGAGRPRPGG